MKKNNIVFCFLILLVISGLQRIYSLDREEKKKSEYINWLNEHKEESNYIEYLFELIDREEDFNKALSYLDKYGSYVKEKKDRALIEKAKADYLYLSGNLSDAQRAYEESWKIYKHPSNEESLYLSSVVLMELGEMEKAKNQIDYLLKNNFSEKIKEKSIFLLAVISLYEKNIDSAIFKLKNLLKTGYESILPDTIYLLYQASIMKGDEAEKNKYYNILKRDYGKSMAYNLISNSDRFSIFPEPVSLMLFSEYFSKSNERFFIQTGSFSIKENAVYLKKDLSKFKFNVEIEKQKKSNNYYYRVLIGPFGTVKEAQIKLKELKERGFSGFIIKR